MTVVIADTSPLNYLVLIAHVEVVIPPEVLAELAASDAPAKVSKWIQTPPDWLIVRHAPTTNADAVLLKLDPGERAAICLAQEENDPLLLIDDAAGRLEASRRGIPTTGTLGVLRAAAVRQFLDLPTALTALAATNFRASQGLIAELLAEDSERKRRLPE
jgi:predicted nucleic acid-binding protein